MPLGPPVNVSAVRNGSQALVRWQEPMAPLQGTLLGYRLAYRGQDTPEVGAASWGGEEGGVEEKLTGQTWTVVQIGEYMVALCLGEHIVGTLRECRGGLGNGYLRIIEKVVQ